MKRISILGKSYSIERIDKTPLNNNIGVCLNLEQRIILTTGMSPEQEADTLLHEIIHAVDWAVLLDLTERQVHALAGALFAVFRDNPGLAEHLLLTSKEEKQ